METKHSDMYQDFLVRCNAEGGARRTDYNLALFHEIYNWERNEIEEKIWEGINKKKDMDLLPFLLELKNFDGRKKLYNLLDNSSAPNILNFNISLILFQNGDKKQLNNLLSNLKEVKGRTEKIQRIVSLRKMPYNKKMLAVFIDIYINDEDFIVRSAVLTNILTCAGLINSNNEKNSNEIVNLKRKYESEDKRERERLIKEIIVGGK